eukprot:3355925-Lingulodinium_polyedra.AAC.1
MKPSPHGRNLVGRRGTGREGAPAPTGPATRPSRHGGNRAEGHPTDRLLQRAAKFEQTQDNVVPFWDFL